MSIDMSMSIVNNQPVLKWKNLPVNFNQKTKSLVFIMLGKYEKAIRRNLGSGKFNIKSRSGQAGILDMTPIVTGVGTSVTGKMLFNKIYARIQEKGGNIKVTDKMASYAWFQWYQTGEVMWKAIALKKGGQITIPAHFFAKLTLRQEKAGLLRFLKEGLENVD